MVSTTWRKGERGGSRRKGEGGGRGEEEEVGRRRKWEGGGRGEEEEVGGRRKGEALERLGPLIQASFLFSEVYARVKILKYTTSFGSK